ncbi:MAG: hypothetical protein J6Y44_00655 [Clostridia bacterium]|nr:hypothetical protein [Clostridia bacterium]
MEQQNTELIKDEQAEETLLTAEAENCSSERADSGSTSKFKDQSSLLKAYKSLEAEFTKRCQRLKALEEENAALKEATETKLGSSADTSGVDGWTSESETREFFEKYPEAASLIDKITAFAVSGENFGKRGFMERAYVDYLIDQCKRLEEETGTREYILSQIEGTPIKDEIIREYLAGVNNSFSPRLLGGAGEIALTPVKRPKTLQEAALLAKEIIKII